MDPINPIIEERQKKAQALQDMGIPLFPAGYDPDMTAASALELSLIHI